MARLTIEDARLLQSRLDRVRGNAIARSGAAQDSNLHVSPPLDELACLMIEAHRIDDVETHLWVVGALALRDVSTRVFMRKWDIGRRSFPHGFERLLVRHPGEPVGDPYPYLAIKDIDWDEDLEHLPREVWITHREIRLAQGSLEERARTSLAARYPVKALRWSMRIANAMGVDE